jgi:hypothetical protein
VSYHGAFSIFLVQLWMCVAVLYSMLLHSVRCRLTFCCSTCKKKAFCWRNSIRGTRDYGSICSTTIDTTMGSSFTTSLQKNKFLWLLFWVNLLDISFVARYLMVGSAYGCTWFNRLMHINLTTTKIEQSI